MMDARLQSPFTALVVGPTGCRKTNLLVSLIENAKWLANPQLVAIDYCYGIWQERFCELMDVNFYKGMIDVEERYEAGGENR